jgi:hypothetical protein
MGAIGRRQMNKDRKLRRYRRKDYREIVEFPVEIVGRDGMVRRYDFEASIRLYQRRMSFAAVRFHDDDLVAAEQGHCRSRIEQLRRSFFHLYGWGTPEGSEGPESVDPEHAGELAGFLVRVLRVSERLALRFCRVDTTRGASDVWYLERPDCEAGLLLYAFSFVGDQADEARRGFFDLVNGLRGVEQAHGDAERLIASHHVADCAFVLTGRAEEVSELAAAAPDPSSPAEMAPTPWDEVRDLVRRGDFPTAFLRCRWILEGQPWHRDAYAVGAMLGVVLRRASDAEDMAFVGTRYFEKDALLAYYLGLARVHQERTSDAVRALRRALELDPRLLVARSLLVLLLVESGRFFAALLASQGPDVNGPSAEAAQHRVLVGTLWRLSGFVGASVLSLVLASLAVAEFGRGALLFLFLVLALVLLGAGVFRQRVEDLGRRHKDEDLQLAMRRIQRRRTEAVS